MPLVVLPISGQCGNIQVALVTPKPRDVTLQVRNWRIEQTFDTPDVTTTGSRGWGENKTVLNRWRGACDLPFDLNRSTLYQGVALPLGPTTNFYVTTGLCSWVSAQGYFQIGAAGTPLEPETDALQYQGKLRLTVYETVNPATNIVETRISFLGTGPLLGPVSGQLSNALIANSL